jgi:hypothetical protein
LLKARIHPFLKRAVSVVSNASACFLLLLSGKTQNRIKSLSEPLIYSGILIAILKNRESETIIASHPPLPSRSSCLLADIVLLNHVEREE